MRLVAESTWVQSFTNDWMRRWLSPQRTEQQNWYLRFVALSTQLVLYCRILRQLTNDEQSRDLMKVEIVQLALEVLKEAHANSDHLRTLNHSMSIPFAALLVLKLSPENHDILPRCAMRFAGDPKRPGAKLPTFPKFNAEQMIAMIWSVAYLIAWS